MGVLVGECSLVSSLKKRHALFFERTNTPLENALVLSFVFSFVLALFLRVFSRVLSFVLSCSLVCSLVFSRLFSRVLSFVLSCSLVCSLICSLVFSRLGALIGPGIGTLCFIVFGDSNPSGSAELGSLMLRTRV